MKFMNKKIFAFLALLSATGHSFGYNFDITNKTKETLVVKVKPRLGSYKFGTIEPGKEQTFAFNGLSTGLCLESISVGKYDPTEKDMESYVLHFVPMKMVDSINDFLEKGSDDKVDKIVTVDKKETEVSGTEKIKQAIAELAGISLCQSRKLVLIDTGKESVIEVNGTKIPTGYNEIIALTEKNK